MKKKIIIIVSIFICILTGCQLSNNPTSKVEELLGKYQMLDKDISISHLNLSNDNSIDTSLQERYEKLIKNQYKNLTYEIKEEKIDGDSATVTVQIEVLDYKSVLEKYEKTDYSTQEYHKKILDELEKVKDKITYTIDFVVTKDKKGDWNTEPLGEKEREKLLGIN